MRDEAERAFTKMMYQEMGRRGGLARAKSLSAKRRQEISRLGGKARWKKAKAAA